LESPHRVCTISGTLPFKIFPYRLLYSSYVPDAAILPAVFQWAGELFYPVNEVVPTGYLCMTGNIGGWLLVLIMGWTEDSSIQFTMLPAMVILIASLLIGMIATFLTNGQLKRLASQQYSIVESRIDA
jgi:hypothetical protein